MKDPMRYRVESKMSGKWERVGRFMLCQSKMVYTNESDDLTRQRYIWDARMLAGEDYTFGPTRVFDTTTKTVVWASSGRVAGEESGDLS